nr:MAG TPA: hypothetical protein [Caudoviricetes sp.]
MIFFLGLPLTGGSFFISACQAAAGLLIAVLEKFAYNEKR